MNTRNFYRLGLIMALFALLLAVSAVAAQDSQPGIPITPIGEDGPIVVQPGAPRAPKDLAGLEAPYETAALTANKNEVESNNSFTSANVMAIGDVMSGKIKPAGDIDYFRVDVSDHPYTVLIDIDAQVNGSPLDPIVCLYATYGSEKRNIGCNDDAEGLDSLLFHRLYNVGSSPGSPYYITVQNYAVGGGNAYTYKLAVYRPLLLSAAVSGTVAGISFDKSDILAHYDFPDVERWKMFFDASDFGISGNIVGLSAADNRDDSVSLVFQKNQTLAFSPYDLKTVTPYDSVSFSPGRFGPNTQGGFSWNYRGATYGLTTASEKIDALADTWVVSTTGAAIFSSGHSVRDEDITDLRTSVSQFVGDAVEGLAVEDVIAADIGYFPDWYLTIQGTGKVDGYYVNQTDIFIVSDNTYRVTGKYWSGGQHHFPYNIDAFDAADW